MSTCAVSGPGPTPRQDSFCIQVITRRPMKNREGGPTVVCSASCAETVLPALRRNQRSAEDPSGTQ